MAYIILTAPHGHEFLNDVITPYVVDELDKMLTKNGHTVLALVNKIPRSFGDMNRQSTRDTPYRRTIETVVRSENKPDFLLDIHGFPDDTDSPLGGHDIVVLRSYPKLQKELPSKYHRLLNRHKVDKINVAIQSATVDNDVVKQALKNGVHAILVEHNESGPVGAYAQMHFMALEELLGGVK